MPQEPLDDIALMQSQTGLQWRMFRDKSECMEVAPDPPVYKVGYRRISEHIDVAMPLADPRPCRGGRPQGFQSLSFGVIFTFAPPSDGLVGAICPANGYLALLIRRKRHFSHYK